MSEISFAPHGATDTPPVTVREILRSVDVPTEPLRITPRTATPVAQSPFGPVRKNQQPPTPKIPGPRQPVDVTPRPAPPRSTFTAPDCEQVASWWDHAEAFAAGVQLTHHADKAFSEGITGGAL